MTKTLRQQCFANSLIGNKESNGSINPYIERVIEFFEGELETSKCEFFVVKQKFDHNVLPYIEDKQQNISCVDKECFLEKSKQLNPITPQLIQELFLNLMARNMNKLPNYTKQLKQ